MLNTLRLKHELALSIAQAGMVQAAQEGIALGSWRDDVLELLDAMRLPHPPDVIAWVSSGKASDRAVTDWGQSFSI